MLAKAPRTNQRFNAGSSKSTGNNIVRALPELKSARLFSSQNNARQLTNKQTGTRVFAQEGIKRTQRTFTDTPTQQTNAQVFLAENVNPSNVVFGKPTKNKAGGQTVYISYPPARLLRIQTPACRLPFGISKPEPGTQGGYSLSLSIDNFQSDAQQKKFFDMLTALDELTVATATNNIASWFPSHKALIPEVLKYNYKPLLRTSSKYPPTMKLKIPMFNEQQPAVRVYRGEGEQLEEVTLDHITRGTNVIAIAEVRGVWFVGANFGLTVRAAQLKIVGGGESPLQGPSFI